MPRARLAIFAIIVFIIGCKTIPEYQKEDKFSDTTAVYEHAISWSDYQSASAFLPPEEAEKIDYEKLKSIKVTSYNAKKIAISDDHLNVARIVEISYFNKNDMVVRTFSEEELWEYDETKGSWFLNSGFPDFDLK